MGLKLKSNVGTVDMVIRVIIALCLGYIGFMPNPIISGGVSQKIIAGVGIVVLLSAIFRWCPFYGMAGISTCKKKCDVKNNVSG